MPSSDKSKQWRCQVGSLYPWILLAGMWKECFSCHSESRYLHACLHTFLERDFTLIQTYQYPYEPGRRTRVLLEGPVLDDTCQRITELHMCFDEEGRRCRGLFDMEAYKRMMQAFTAILHFLCDGERQGLMDFLKYGPCLEYFRSLLPVCDNKDLPWLTVWMKIFRLQVGTEVCPSLVKQRNCILQHWYSSPCEIEARDLYNNTFTFWVDNWCNTGTKTQAQLITLLVVLVPIVAGFF